MTQDASETYDENLALLVRGLAPHAPEPEARARLLGELRGPERWTPWAASVAALLQIEEADSHKALQKIEDQAEWLPGLWPRSSILQTGALKAVRALIARLPPGTRIARHKHTTRELTYVLAGELLEDDRRSYGPGELADMDVGTEHELTVAGTSDCLVVFFLPSA